ncbi:hypothetical protein RhiirA4_471341 [Rhizophagus irregularis]|uniref:RING-type domain-containing protein n=1 Tax=Rhizophagus irregularis TaxID=588596 RepID=A0A2I1H313_9GLOM|nr:hypothetical protein RhiirA4_471341 [Rhizophagus irregularis]
MSDHGIHEPYIGYNTLVAYLESRTNWSYRGFLEQNHNIMVASSHSNSNWNDLDISWSRRFLTEAQKLGQGFAELEQKVESERNRNGLQSYWEGIINEFKRISELKGFAYKIIFHENPNCIPEEFNPQNLYYCGICKEEILPQLLKPITILTCRHLFHRNCIEQNQFLPDLYCPLCKNPKEQDYDSVSIDSDSIRAIDNNGSGNDARNGTNCGSGSSGSSSGNNADNGTVSDSGVGICPHPPRHPFRRPHRQCCIRDSSYHPHKVLNSQSQLHFNDVSVNDHHENDNNNTMIGNDAVQNLGAIRQNNINSTINNRHENNDNNHTIIGNGSAVQDLDLGALGQNNINGTINNHHENNDNNHTIMGNGDGTVQDLGALGQNNINGTNNHHEISGYDHDHKSNSYYEDMNIEGVSSFQPQGTKRSSETAEEIAPIAKRTHKSVTYSKIASRLSNEISDNELVHIVSHMEEYVRFLDFPNLSDLAFSTGNTNQQIFLDAVDHFFPTLSPIVDSDSATAAITSLDRQLMSGRAIIFAAENTRLEASYLYNYVYRECAKIALASTPVAGRKEKRKVILNFIAEKMEGDNTNARKKREYRMHRTALCLRYLLMYIDKKMLSRAGITISHLGSTSNDELKAFITEVFSVRAAERMIKWLHLTSNGRIPDVLLQGTIYYREDDEIDGIEPLDPD